MLDNSQENINKIIIPLGKVFRVKDGDQNRRKENANKRRNTTSFPAAEELGIDSPALLKRKFLCYKQSKTPKLSQSCCVAVATFERMSTQKKKGPKIPSYMLYPTQELCQQDSI